MTRPSAAESEAAKRGYRWSVRVVQPISSSQGEVWRTISRPGNLELCHPFCVRNPVHRWPGPDSLDEVHYSSGWIFERQFCRWLEGVGYDLEIGRQGGRSSFVEWRISRGAGRGSALEIAVYPYSLGRVPAPLRGLTHLLYIKPKLRSYLSSVTRGFEWYITRGEPVPREHYGRHPWFSARKGGHS